jgi:hypothetical protein
MKDMVGFVTFIPGSKVVRTTTTPVKGLKPSKLVLVGGITSVGKGNKVTCHDMLFLYLLYYCKAIPKVKVYGVELLNNKTKLKINEVIVIAVILGVL